MRDSGGKRAIANVYVYAYIVDVYLSRTAIVYACTFYRQRCFRTPFKLCKYLKSSSLLFFYERLHREIRSKANIANDDDGDINMLDSFRMVKFNFG